MTKEELLLARRFADLSRQAQMKGIATFSDFLNLNEMNIFHTAVSDLYTEYETWGGYEDSERQMIAFIPDALVFQRKYPIRCCEIKPLNPKFADLLTHRDVLGSIMHLGVERGMIGDILVRDSQIYLFCHEKISSFLMEELTRVKHTQVRLTFTEQITEFKPCLESCSAVISSPRLDSLVAALCKISRSQASELIKNGKVFVNSRETVSTSYVCRPSEIISVRSFGRFRFEECVGETRKGRCRIQYQKYV